MKLKKLQHEEELLEDCIEDIINNEQNVKICLEENPHLTSSMKEKLELVSSLYEFRNLRAPKHLNDKSLFVKMIREKKQRPAHINAYRLFGNNEKATLVLRFGSVMFLLAIFLFLSIYSVATVSAKALPGQTLYPVKIAIENWRLNSSKSDVDRVNIYLFIASRRLSEINAALQEGNYEGVSIALLSYDQQIQNINAVLQKSQSYTPREQLTILSLIDHWFSNRVDELAFLVDNFPQGEYRSRIEDSLSYTKISQIWVDELTNQIPDSYFEELNFDEFPGLFETPGFGAGETNMFPTNFPTLWGTNTPMPVGSTRVITPTPNAENERPLYNKSLTKTPENLPTDKTMPTNFPTPKRTSNPPERLPTKTLPAKNPTNWPQELPTRTPLLP
jgi:hypothetical protein